MTNLYTKTGDAGTTSLVGGNRVSKDNPRVHCYGTIDEANAILGMAYALTENQYIRECIDQIQRKLFILGAELASDWTGRGLLGEDILREADVDALEGIVDRCTLTTGSQTSFVIPGVNTASAALHMARTVVRRAERTMIAAKGNVEFRDVLFRFVNRLSDAVYALARLEETIAQQGQNKNCCRNWPPKESTR